MSSEACPFGSLFLSHTYRMSSHKCLMFTFQLLTLKRLMLLFFKRKSASANKFLRYKKRSAVTEKSSFSDGLKQLGSFTLIVLPLKRDPECFTAYLNPVNDLISYATILWHDQGWLKRSGCSFHQSMKSLLKCYWGLDEFAGCFREPRERHW